MLSERKYFSPTLQREVDYDEFKSYSSDELNSLLDNDLKVFEKMVREEPCDARDKLNRGFFTYTQWLIRDNLEMYNSALKHRIKTMADLLRKVFDLTKSKTYEFEYTITSEVPIPFEKIVKSSDLVPIKSENDSLAGIRIRNIHSNDDTHAPKLGERKLNQFLGYLALYSNELSMKVGEWQGSFVDICGQSMMMVGTEMVSVKQILWERCEPLILQEMESWNFSGGVVLDLLYIAALSEYREIWRGAYLNMYLALELIVEFKGLNLIEFKKYRWIRNSLVHPKLDQGRTNKALFDFLAKEFGSDTPDWEDADTQVKLGNWTRYLKGEIRKIIFGHTS